MQDFAGWQSASGLDASSQAANPLFVNAAAGDFHLLPGSSCIDAGTATGAPGLDLDNVARPQGLQFDIGAYEYAARPTAAFTAAPTSGNSPLQVQFTDTSAPGSSPIVSWEWDFNNDGVTDSVVPNPLYPYTLSGRYSVSLRVTNAVGSDTHTEIDFVHVTSGPSAEFTAAPIQGLAPLLVSFTDASVQGTSAIAQWSWDFNGDGLEDSSERNPVHAFGAGLHTISLRITDTAGFSDTRIRADYVKVDSAPAASFTAAPLSGIVPLSIVFTDTSAAGTQPIVQWLWDFGDGQSSTQQNPEHTYTTAGDFTVALTVTSAAGSSTSTMPGLIAVALPIGPAAAFSGTPLSGLMPLTVQFSDQSLPGSYAISAWEWDFGDGQTSMEPAPSHTFHSPGTYTVSLRVTTAAGSDTESKAGYVSVTGGPGPAASFTSDKTQGLAPHTVQFTDTSSPGGAAIESWLWAFGDASTSTAQHPSHTYPAAGTYTVRLTVTTDLGSDTIERPAYIKTFTAVHVDKGNMSGVEDGTSWSRAFRTVQAAVDLAQSLDGAEVWVAGGSFGEERSDANGALVMRSGVHLFGGFAGHETSREQRNWTLYTTTIDGSMSRGGEPAYHVVTGANNATLDGFIITGGQANSGSSSRDRGAGIFNQNASPTIAHCVIRNNTASYAGGGMYNANAAPRVVACRFEANTTTGSFFSQGYGGAVYNTGSSNARFENCVFAGNVAQATLLSDGLGGAMYSTGSAPLLLNCSFFDNRSYGAIFSDGNGGALYNRLASPVLTNCILWGDLPNEIENSGTGGAVATYSDVQGGYPGAGNLNSDPEYREPGALNLEIGLGSPCADTGTGTGAPSMDIRGVSRPQGAGVDMGAYEIAGAPPSASFSVSAVRGVVPFEVAFTDTSEPGSVPIAAWLWDFGDGETESVQHPNHVYTAPGDYLAVLTVWDTAMQDAVSAAQLVTVALPLQVGSGPESSRVYSQASVLFEVNASGGLGELTYQWWHEDGSKSRLLADEIESVLTLDSVTPPDSGLYWCVVSDEVDSQATNAALLEVADPLEIITQPDGGVAEANGSHTFRITVRGGFQPLTYLWIKDDMPLDVPNEPVLVLQRLSVTDAGRYRVEVYDTHTMMRVSDEVSLEVEANSVPVAEVPGGVALALACVLIGAFAIFRDGRAARPRRERVSRSGENR